MIEIGLQRIVPIRKRVGKKLVQVKDSTGQPATRVANAIVRRVTRNELDGSFGRDRGRKLVVSMEAGDRLVLRPSGTRQAVDAPLADIYRWMVWRRAARMQLEKARERKAIRQRQRESRRLDAAERRLRKSAREQSLCQ